MTVLVGILCQDGVVIGSDSVAVSTDGAGQPTLKFPSAAKVERISDHIITATTGAVGFSQRYQNHIKDLWNRKKFQDIDQHKAAHLVTATVLNDFNLTYGYYPSAKNLGFGALMGLIIADKQHLIEYAGSDFQPEFKYKERPIVTMGSGQPIADPFLRFIHRVFWQEQQPTLAEGILATVWTLDHTIQTNPWSIGGELQIGILKRAAKGRWSAEVLEGDNLHEAEQNAEDMEKYLIGSYREKLNRKDQSEDIEEIPRPQIS